MSVLHLIQPALKYRGMNLLMIKYKPMFNKTNANTEKTVNGNGTTIINAGTVLRGDIDSHNDIRIDGTIIGNIKCKAKIVIGVNGAVEGNIEGNQADVVGKVTGNIHTKDLLQLRGACIINGDVEAGKLQVEPTAVFNGKCQMAQTSPARQKPETPMANINTAKFTVDRNISEAKTAVK
jgi:cytoskeletal protein CcmA (bactofilin family)